MKDNVQVIMPPSRTVTANGKSTALLLRVCAYCRVSTDEDEQMHSIGEQKDEYENRIKSNPDWTFVGIYSDEGISGTDVKHRTQFMRMMQDAREGKIDLILTKSISRFGRNTMDTVNSVRELKKLGVYIKFETEGIYTKDDCEFILTMLASVAQEEARHISVNVKWNCEKRMREGIPILCHTTFLGYTKDAQTKKLIVVPEEAKIIQEIYGMYTAYVGPNEICRTMEKKGYKTGRGQTKWYLSYVQSILKNEKYCGDLLQQKSVTTDFLAHKRAKNINLAPKYYIKDDHEAIIPRDVWEKAQEIRKARAEQRQHGNKNIQRYLNRYPYSGLIMCGECGGPFKRRYWNYGFDCQRIVYQCSDRTSNRSTCKKANIDLIVLEKCTAEVIHKFMSSNEHVYDDIKEIVTDCYTIDQIEVTLRELQSEKDKLTESISKLIDLKLQSKNSSELEIYNNKQDEYSAKLQKINFEINKLKLSSIADESMKRYDNLKNKLKEFQQGKIDIDGELIHAVINKIIVLDEHTVVYCIPKNRIQTSEEIKLFRKKYINFPAMFEGRIDDTRNKKHYYIEYKAVMI